MKLATLTKALECLAQSPDCSKEELQDVYSSIRSLAAVADRYQSSKDWHDEVTVITAWTLDNVLNHMTYDIYGKRKRIHGNEMQFMYYAADCRKQFDLEELTDEQLRFGYDIIADLWADNEREGNNNVLDGTFAKD